MIGKKDFEIKTMKKLVSVVFCIFILGLTGCATKQPLTVEQMSNALAENQAAATRNYPGKSQKEVLQASQKVLYLLDPTPHMAFDIDNNKLYARRMSLLYLVLITSWTVDQYNVTVSESKDGTQASFAMGGAGSIYIPPPLIFDKNLVVGANENPADFKLFHDRLEYTLGLRKNWVTCAEAKAAQKDPSRSMFLCDSVGLDNYAPDDPAVKPLN